MSGRPWPLSPGPDRPPGWPPLLIPISSPMAIVTMPFISAARIMIDGRARVDDGPRSTCNRLEARQKICSPTVERTVARPLHMYVNRNSGACNEWHSHNRHRRRDRDQPTTSSTPLSALDFRQPIFKILTQRNTIPISEQPDQMYSKSTKKVDARNFRPCLSTLV